YLAGFNADQTFREPLEGLVRLLERRRSTKNLGKIFDALVRAAVTPDERVRALVQHAAFLEDVSHDLTGAKAALLDATEAGASVAESSCAWLALELVAAKLAGAPDAGTEAAELRERALFERAKRATDPTWRALLQIDEARLAAALGE